MSHEPYLAVEREQTVLAAAAYFSLRRANYLISVPDDWSGRYQRRVVARHHGHNKSSHFPVRMYPGLLQAHPRLCPRRDSRTGCVALVYSDRINTDPP